MPSELSIHAEHLGGMRVTAGDGTHSVSMDYPAGAGQTALTPLQLLLASLAGCAANTVAAVLRRSGRPVGALSVHARGLRRDEHPTVFTEIALEFVVRGAEIDADSVARAIEVAEERLCPVWAMLKPGTRIASSFRVEREPSRPSA